MNNEQNWADRITPASEQDGVTAGDNNTKVVFDDAQQSKLNALLAAERKAGEARYEALRKDAALQIARLKGTTDAGSYLEAKLAETNAAELEKEQLRVWFSSRPGAGSAANKLSKEDPILYKKLRQRAQFHGLIA